MNLIRIGIPALMVTAALTTLHAQADPDTMTPAQIALACASTGNLANSVAAHSAEGR